MPSPTQKALKQLKLLKYPAEVVEKWNSFSRQKKDLFNVIDIVAIYPRRIVGIQVTVESAARARIKKAYENKKEIIAWLKAGGDFYVWGFPNKNKSVFVSYEFRLDKEKLIDTKTYLCILSGK